MNAEDVRKIVMEEAMDLAAGGVIPRGSDHLARDLKIDGDDLSFEFVPNILRRCGVNVPVDAWRKVGTIDETVDLIVAHLEQE
jgi:hypothetical protein